MTFRLAANISTMFRDLPLEDRPRAARDAGFAAVEVQYPYSVPAARLAVSLADAGLDLIQLNAQPGGNGLKGFACLPDGEREFEGSVGHALAYARETRCKRIHVLCGCLPENGDAGAAFERAAHRFAIAVDRAKNEGVRIVVETINRKDAPGYLVGSVDDAVKLIAAVGALSASGDAPGLLLDVYHLAMNKDDLREALRRHSRLVDHVQISDMPGRGPPGSGDLDWRSIFDTLAQSDYEDLVGCEYFDDGSGKAYPKWIDRLDLSDVILS